MRLKIYEFSSPADKQILSKPGVNQCGKLRSLGLRIVRRLMKVHRRLAMTGGALSLLVLIFPSNATAQSNSKGSFPFTQSFPQGKMPFSRRFAYTLVQFFPSDQPPHLTP